MKLYKIRKLFIGVYVLKLIFTIRNETGKNKTLETLHCGPF